VVDAFDGNTVPTESDAETPEIATVDDAISPNVPSEEVPTFPLNAIVVDMTSEPVDVTETTALNAPELARVIEPSVAEPTLPETATTSEIANVFTAPDALIPVSVILELEDSPNTPIALVNVFPLKATFVVDEPEAAIVPTLDVDVIPESGITSELVKLLTKAVEETPEDAIEMDVDSEPADVVDETALSETDALVDVVTSPIVVSSVITPSKTTLVSLNVVTDEADVTPLRDIEVVGTNVDVLVITELLDRLADIPIPIVPGGPVADTLDTKCCICGTNVVGANVATIPVLATVEPELDDATTVPTV